MGSLRFVLVCSASLLSACSAADHPNPTGGGAGGDGGSGGAAAGGGTGGGLGGMGGMGGADPCACLPGPHNDLIYTLSDDGEIWSFDPREGSFSFAYVRTLLCTGAERPFSMAVDHRGQAWVLSASTSLIFVFDLAANQGCDNSSYTPHQAAFDLFGMAFSSPGSPAECPLLYVHSYSGDGPFAEGPGLGTLGAIVPDTGSLTELATIDYDGGELAGTGEGQLFAFAGVSPVKLIEYDRRTGATLDTLPLYGLSKTSASAFAFYGGDAFIFTEAMPAGCISCLEQSCHAELSACLADPSCELHFQCAIDMGDISDECGGMMPTPLQDCLATTCGSECLLPSSEKVSQVTRLDYDESEGGGQALTVVVPQAPIRVVGAGDSVCVPATPR